MRAVVSRVPGPPESLTVEELALPEPGEGQVRVAVSAAAVGFPDVLLVADRYQVQAARPFTPGSELAGTVSAVGPGVTGLRIGDRVVGTAMTGAFAEQVVLATAALMPLPDTVATHDAAGFLVAYTTALGALRVARPGDRVLVLGAAGGVGLAIVDLATTLGMTVVAAAATAAKLEACASAAHKIEYGDSDPVRLRQALRELGGVDVAVDPVGGALSEAALRALRPGGRFVTVGYASGTIPAVPLNLVLLKRVQVSGFDVRADTEADPVAAAASKARLLGMLGRGELHPVVSRTFPLDQAAAALQLVADRKAVGRVLVIP